MPQSGEPTGKTAKNMEGTAGKAVEQDKPEAPWLELPLAWISYLRTEISRQECTGKETDCDRKKLIAGAKNHLRIAESACTEGRPWFRWVKKSNRLERIWANVRAADVNLLALSSDQELIARSGHIRAMVRNYIHKDSPQRIQAEDALKRIAEKATPPKEDETRRASREEERRGSSREGEALVSLQDRLTAIQALGITYSALDTRTRRVRIFANVLWVATGLTFLGAAGIAIWGAFDPHTLNLCFNHLQNGDQIPGNRTQEIIACPTGDRKVVTGHLPNEYVDPLDVLSVELAGLVGAALTTIAALRRIHDDHTSPYALPLAAATLKFPLGAIAAFAGIVFMRGSFLPGLSALDSPMQILAWAILFGAAQQLVTHVIDEKAQTTLSGIGKSPNPPGRAPADEAF
ncbi:hypothetical protein [Streptomyces sp. NPDC001401]|uniref:hypothetical protein n=1 Tax=Streptomyces sp. NPDC001401 TaxID=3364570 RepID=UPI003680BAD1